MRVLLINLDRHIERRNWMDRLLIERRVAYERVDAVDAHSLSRELMETANKSRAGMSELASGEVACNLSHKNCWEIIAQGEDDYGCVLEDDLHLSRDTASFLSSSEWIPADADIIKIETFAEPVFCKVKGSVPVHARRLRRLIGRHLGSAGYIVSKKAAKRLLELFGNCYDSPSFIMFSQKYDGLARFNVLQLDPAICIQDMRFPKSGQNPQLSTTINHYSLTNGPTVQKRGKIPGSGRRGSGLEVSPRRKFRSVILKIRMALRYFSIARIIPFDD